MRTLTGWALGAGLLLWLVASASAETAAERGAYLVRTVGACGNCHTPRDAAGRWIAGRELAGGFEFDDPGLGHIVGTNITPDPETGIGKWSEAEIVTALRDGKRPDGTLIRPPIADPGLPAAIRQRRGRDCRLPEKPEAGAQQGRGGALHGAAAAELRRAGRACR
jgi:hypothetical protein